MRPEERLKDPIIIAALITALASLLAAVFSNMKSTKFVFEKDNGETVSISGDGIRAFLDDKNSEIDLLKSQNEELTLLIDKLSHEREVPKGSSKEGAQLSTNAATNSVLTANVGGVLFEVESIKNSGGEVTCEFFFTPTNENCMVSFWPEKVRIIDQEGREYFGYSGAIGSKESHSYVFNDLIKGIRSRSRVILGGLPNELDVIPVLQFPEVYTGSRFYKIQIEGFDLEANRGVAINVLPDSGSLPY